MDRERGERGMEQRQRERESEKVGDGVGEERRGSGEQGGGEG